MSIVTDDMEHPEHRGSPAQIFWNVVVTSPDRSDQTLEVGGVPDVFAAEGAAFDEIENENAGLRVHHFGA